MATRIESPQVVPMSLLLLCPPPWPPEKDTIRAAFEIPLSTVLDQLSNSISKATAGAILDIALPLPFLHAHLLSPRTQLFTQIQKVVAEIYSLICLIAAREKYNVEDAEGIDVRLLLLAHSTDGETEPNFKEGTLLQSRVDAVVSLQTLAKSQRPWHTIYAIENEQSEDILRKFLVTQNRRVNVRRVAFGSMKDAATQFELHDDSIESSKRHKSIAVGGTWDHVHIGHKLLLTMFAFLLDPNESASTRTLTVGITGDELLGNKKYPEILQSWTDRQRSSRALLESIMDFRPPSDIHVKEKEVSEAGPNGHAIRVQLSPETEIRLVEISDPFGPTITDEEISALVLSAETRSGGKAVNDKRAEKTWAPLQLFEVDVLCAADDEGQQEQIDDSFKSKLSSTTIRQSLSERGRMRSKT